VAAKALRVGPAAKPPKTPRDPLLGAFGEALRRLRHARRWSLRELATHTGLHYSALARLEQGEGWPEWETLKTLMETYGWDTGADLLMALVPPEVWVRWACASGVRVRWVPSGAAAGRAPGQEAPGPRSSQAQAAAEET
jgi:transcriptional regulator with XRE-family HTH domain